ncbi:hypothetical protein SBADM41S_08431 [Streptomyces badius]
MKSAVAAAPIRAACALASMAAAPRVGPTVRCSTISTGTGRAPPLISSARSRASSALNDPVIWVAPDGSPASQPTEGSTCGDEMTFSSRTMATLRRSSPAGWHAASPVSFFQS